MARGDSIPRYTYAMDFNPLDEQSPLADFWQMNDGLDSEDAAVIATLATQALQSKLGYEYEDSVGVNEPAEVANYTESRSSPQSQYSAIAQEEPAESFRGLMEDHDRGAQFSGADTTNEYDMEPAARGRISDTVAAFEEQAAFSRDSNLHDPIYSLLNVSTETDEVRATMTASQIVNEVLRNSELAAAAAAAAAQSQMDVNIQALHSQAAQLTPPDSESPSISAEERDHRELEEDSLADTNEQHEDCEPEDVVMEEPSPDTEAQQQLMTESNERPTIVEDEDEDEDESREPSPSPAPRKIRRLRKSDTVVESPDLVPKETDITEIALPKKVVAEEDAVVEEAVTEEAAIEEAVVEEAAIEEAVAEAVVEEVAEEEVETDGTETNEPEETPAARRRGRPRKSEVAEPTPASSTKRRPGRPPKLIAPEAASESTPTTGKRGRPRKSEVEDQSQIHPEESDKPIDEAPAATPAASKRGRPRKSEMADESQIHTKAIDVTAEEATPAATAPGKRGRPRKSDAEMRTKEFDIPREEAVATPAAGKRGRPRKSEVEDKSQVADIPAETIPAAISAAGKRGRPRKSETGDQSQAHTKAIDITAEEATATRSVTGKRGRPRKSEVEDKSQITDIPAGETAPTTSTTGKRGRPRKSEVVETAQDFTDEHTLATTEATNPTPAPGKRGRPRKSEVISTTQNLTDKNASFATETSVSTSTPGKRGRPPKGDAARVSMNESQPSIVGTVIVTPATGKRGRPRKSDAVLAIAPETSAVPELQAEAEVPTTADIAPSTTETMEQLDKPFGHDDAVKEQHISSFTATVQKRGRGRPPKSGILVSTATDSETAENVEEAEPQGLNSEHMEDIAGDIAVDENLSTEPVSEDIEATPARKRGRPKYSGPVKLSPMISAPVTASAKKRGRPPKASIAEESAEALEEPTQLEAEETEERIAKRKRTDSDVVMEDSAEDSAEDCVEDSVEDLIRDLLEDPMEDPMEDDPTEAREEQPTSVRKRRVSFAADTKAPKSLVPIRSIRRNSDSTGLKSGFFSINTPRIPRLGGPTDRSKENAGAEVPQKSTASQQTELFISRLPRPTVDSVFDGKKLGKRPKTYGRRLKK